MKRSEYWILSAAVEYRVPLGWLDLPNVGHLLNRESHGLSRNELISVLQQLLADGDIVIHSHGGEQPRPTVKELDDSLHYVPPSRHEDYTWYGLTSKGAYRWERAAQPKWQHFIEEGIDDERRPASNVPGDSCAHGDHYIIAGDRSRVLNLFRAYVSLSERLPFPAAHANPVKGSETWRTLKPWKATYWKDIPVAYKLSFKTVAPKPVQLGSYQSLGEKEARGLWQLNASEYSVVSELHKWFTEPDHFEDEA